MRISRRRFLGVGAAAAAGLASPGSLDSALAAIARGISKAAPGHGALQADPARLLDLPRGFTYVVMSTATLWSTTHRRFSQRLDGGDPVPAMHDGMGAFAGPGGATILVRNHELNPGHRPEVDPGRTRRYDPLGAGGTTTLWVDAEGLPLRSFASLSGTFRNCAGGATPWGSWLSAEECTYMPGQFDLEVHDRRPDVAARHGYLFEVDAHAEGLVAPVPIVAMGRFCHEAVAVDPASGFVYLTEDREDGLLYRYRPSVVTGGAKPPSDLAVGDLAKGGALEALRIPALPGASTHNWSSRSSRFAPGESFEVDWVGIRDVDPDVDMERDPGVLPDPLRLRPRTAPGSTRAQGWRLGAAQFARMEGICLHGKNLYFCCTTGGPARAGQVWRLDLDRATLALVVQPDDRAVLDGPDNIVAAPNGDLLMCEDGRGDQYLLGLTPEGGFYPIARNAHNRRELAGACFSPDGATLFVNIQEPGITFAIRGPWEARKA